MASIVDVEPAVDPNASKDLQLPPISILLIGMAIYVFILLLIVLIRALSRVSRPFVFFHPRARLPHLI